MSCSCQFSYYVSGLKMLFLLPNVCMLQVSRVLRPGPCLTRTNGSGATTGTTSSPSCLGLLAVVFKFWGAIQPFSFLLGSTLPSRIGIEVLWRCFPPKRTVQGRQSNQLVKRTFSKLTSYKSVKAMLSLHILI